MKNVFAEWHEDERLKNDPNFLALYQTYLQALSNLKEAKIAQSAAQSEYRSAIENNQLGPIELLEIRTSCRQAKCMREYHAQGYELACERLYFWLERWKSAHQ